MADSSETHGGVDTFANDPEFTLGPGERAQLIRALAQRASQDPALAVAAHMLAADRRHTDGSSRLTDGDLFDLATIASSNSD